MKRFLIFFAVTLCVMNIPMTMGWNDSTAYGFSPFGIQTSDFKQQYTDIHP